MADSTTEKNQTPNETPNDASVESSEAPSQRPKSFQGPKSLSRQDETLNRVTEISSLLDALANSGADGGSAPLRSQPPKPDLVISDRDRQLVESRLGVATSLFTALRHKHPQTAAHSLRIAISCSCWASYAGLDDETCDTIELAALMHDIGKIGVPDAILLKPSRLNEEEAGTISRHHQVGLEILGHCCGTERVLNAMRYVGVRYDGLQSGQELCGDAMPLASRMISIVDAYDAMTTDHVYRPAKSRDHAMTELFECAGTQFDPVLVKQFVEARSQSQDGLTQQTVSRWLSRLVSADPMLPWTVPVESVPLAPAPVEISHPLFEQKLVDAMHDGVVFVDTQAKITMWSKSVERLTGVNSAAAVGRAFAPSLIDMCNHAHRRISDEACPVAKALLTNSQLRQRLMIVGRRDKHITVDMHVIPVHATDGAVQGAVILVHDAQPEASLEEKCEALLAEVTKDPMTKVANRAEFDRMLALFIEAHQQAGLPCSLIMCDLDHFKNINDTFGHQAGDEAIISLANLLTSLCRAGDLVARYGGEEFAVLCAGCSNADGTRRAEEIRCKLAEVQHACLGNKRITASFGVTELQAGDTPETMLRRSDRALLTAKEQGRNQVVQLGNGMEKEQKKKKWWKFGRLRSRPVLETTLVTAVPIDISIEKLRGFISDHRAKIIATHSDSVEMEISSEKIAQNRRKRDRHVTFRVELKFNEKRVERSNTVGLAVGEYVHTEIELSIRPKRMQTRRKADTAERAKLLLQSIKAYLMANDVAEAQTKATNNDK